MEYVRQAVSALNPQEAYLVSDRAVELLLYDGRRIRITAQENLKGEGFSADHELRVPFKQDDRQVSGWAHVDLPWATGDTIEECLTSAILLLKG